MSRLRSWTQQRGLRAEGCIALLISSTEPIWRVADGSNKLLLFDIVVVTGRREREVEVEVEQDKEVCVAGWKEKAFLS